MTDRMTRWLFPVLCFLAVPAPAADHSATMPGAIGTLLSRHDQALNEQDLPAILNTFSDDAILMGTGPGEEWVGKDAIGDAYRHFFADYDAGSQRIDCTWHTTGGNDELAWLAAMCWFSDALKNERREFAVNLSAVAERHGDGWRFRTFHFSNVTAPEPPATATR